MYVAKFVNVPDVEGGEVTKHFESESRSVAVHQFASALVSVSEGVTGALFEIDVDADGIVKVADTVSVNKVVVAIRKADASVQKAVDKFMEVSNGN